MEDIILYHGSKGGITCNISPNKSYFNDNDFGVGFYMGSNKIQAQTLVADKQNPVIYTLKFHLSNIPTNRILELNGMDWAFFVLCNRNKIKETNPDIVKTDFYQRYMSLAKNKDVIIGPIADDKMFVAIDNFARRLINDTTLLKAIGKLNFGTQYVAKTQFACNQIEILSKHIMHGAEQQHYQKIGIENRKKGALAFQEIVDEGLEGEILTNIIKYEIITNKHIEYLWTHIQNNAAVWQTTKEEIHKIKTPVLVDLDDNKNMNFSYMTDLNLVVALQKNKDDGHKKTSGSLGMWLNIMTLVE